MRPTELDSIIIIIDRNETDFWHVEDGNGHEEADKFDEDVAISHGFGV